ncbi:MAG: hypothetical protein AAFX50_21700, partial [Acidobacteriota bacterium]
RPPPAAPPRALPLSKPRRPALKADALSLAAATAAVVAGLWLMLMAWNVALWSDDRRIDRVERSIDEARQLGVALAHPALFDRALSNIESARRAAAVERGRFWVRRYFLSAEGHLDQARRDAAALLDAARVARTHAESSAHRQLDRAQHAVDRVVTLYAQVPLNPATRLEVAFMQRDLHRLTGDLNLAELAYSGGEPVLAGSWARHVEQEAVEVAALIDLSQTARRFAP